jgi:hypothetical protein
MRYVIVDDDPAYRESRQRWLLDERYRSSRHEFENHSVEVCDALTFEDALALNEG